MSSTYLIFGNGFIATHLAWDILKKEKSVNVVGHKSINENIPKSIQIKGCNHIPEIENILRKINPDYIFLTQGISFIPSTERDLERSIQANLMAPLKVLETAYNLVQAGQIDVKKIVTFGSAAEYGDGGAQAFSEDTPVNPSSIYGLSKYWLYQLSQYYAHLEIPCVHVRQFNTIGIYQSPMFVLSSFCRQLALIEKGKHKAVLEVGDLAQKRDFIDIRDAVDAYHLVIKKATTGSVVNVCTGQSKEVTDLITHLKEIAKVSFDVKVNDKFIAAKRTRNTVLSGKPAILKGWGWAPKYGIEESIEWVLNDWRKKV